MALFVEGMDGRIALSSQIEYREGTKRRPMALSVDSIASLFAAKFLEWTDGSFANGVSRGIGRRP